MGNGSFDKTLEATPERLSPVVSSADAACRIASYCFLFRLPMGPGMMVMWRPFGGVRGGICGLAGLAAPRGGS